MIPDRAWLIALSALGIVTAAADGALTLQVQPTTFETAIANTDPDAIDFDYYSITSAGQLLTPSSWMSLEDSGLDFFEISATPSELSEVSFGSLTLLPGQSLSLGRPLGESGQAVPLLGGDAVFEYSTLGGALVRGSIVVVPEPASGTFAMLAALALMPRLLRIAARADDSLV